MTQKSLRINAQTAEKSMNFGQQRHVLRQIRKLQSKKNIKSQDLENLIQLINSNSVVILRHLAKFFITLKIELILIEKNHRENIFQNHGIHQQKTLNRYLELSSNEGLPNYEVIWNLYIAIIKKEKAFRNLNFGKYFSNFPQINQKVENLKTKLGLFLTNYYQDIFKNFLFSEASELCRTIKEDLTFLAYFEGNDTFQEVKKALLKDQHLKKDIFVEQILAQSKIKPDQALLTEKKVYQGQNNQNIFDDFQFYEIKEMLEKVSYLLHLADIEGPFRNLRKKQFKSVPIKCIGCAQFVYLGKNIPRDRSSITLFQVMNTIGEGKDIKRLKKIIQKFTNQSDGGVILFDFQDNFFEVSPLGFQSNLKNLQFKKQSLIDICRNNFKNFKIDEDFSIDFIFLCDQEGRIIKTSNSQKLFFLTRMKIKSKPKGYRLISINESQQNQNSKNNSIKEQNSIENIQEFYNKMKFNFFSQEKNLQKYSKPQIKQKYNQAFYNNFKAVSQVLRGRKMPLLRHGSKQCRQVENTKQCQYRYVEDIKQQGTQNYVLDWQQNTYKLWTLLIIKASQKEKIMNQLKNLGIKDEIKLEIIFMYIFEPVDYKCLIKIKYPQDQLIQLIKKAQQNSNLRIYSKIFYNSIKCIKIYSHIQIIYRNKKTNTELLIIKKQLQNQFKKCILQQIITDCTLIMFQTFQNKVYLTTKSSQISYFILFVYNLLKHQINYKNQTEIISIDFKKELDANATPII